MAKVFEVLQYCTTVQGKYVLAENADEALQMTEDDNWEWNGKDEVIDGETKVAPPDDGSVNYVEISPTEYVEFNSSIHTLATEADCVDEEAEPDYQTEFEKVNALLTDIMQVLNQIPNTKINHPKFKNSYAAAAAVSAYLKKSE